MSLKKEKKAPAGAPLWMVTYSDMVTLLLTFFVMLLAMANFEDIKRIDAVMGSIQASLGMGNKQVTGEATGDEKEEGKEADSEAEQDFHTMRTKCYKLSYKPEMVVRTCEKGAATGEC